jgi:hypothetical protein
MQFTIDTKSDSVRLERPLTLNLGVYAVGDRGESPNWAKVVLTQELLDRLLHLRNLAIREDLTKLSEYGEPTLWSEVEEASSSAEAEDEDASHDEDSFRGDFIEEGGEVTVVKDLFWYSANIKHADYRIETLPTPFELLCKVISAQADVTLDQCQRFGDVLIFAWPPSREDFIDGLLQDGEKIPGLSSVVAIAT